MDISSIFEGFFGFVTEEVIVGAFEGVLWISLSSTIRTANATGFSNVVPFLILLFIVILVIPVILHLDDIHDLIK